MNLRPPGYEPGELPNCSTPRQREHYTMRHLTRASTCHMHPLTSRDLLCSCVVVSWWCPALPYPGGCSTIGAGGLSFRVRYGAGRGSPAMTTRTGLVRACPTVPAVPVWGWWCRGCVPRVLFSCPTPARAPVWCGPACVAGVGRGPYSGRPPPARGGWSVARSVCLTRARSCVVSAC